jgi:MFS family permease
LAFVLAMAMFVLVVDTSLMNVSISAVVKDLDTNVSGVQSAIALGALVSAAFILISSKVGDAVTDSRQFRGRGAGEGVCPRRRLSRCGRGGRGWVDPAVAARAPARPTPSSTSSSASTPCAAKER